MKKNVFKKAFAVAMSVMMVGAFMTGCGSKSGSDENVLVIGGSGPLTGDYSTYGISVKQGAELAVKEINEAGGVNGTEFKLVFEDDMADPTSAASAYATMADNGMQVSLGATTSGACLTAVAEAEKDGILVVTPSASQVECAAPENVFRICFTDPLQGAYAAQVIKEKNIGTKVAVIYDSSSSYSSGIYENFAKEAKAEAIEIVATGSFTADNNTDFSVQLQDAKNNGAELVFLPVYYQQACIILKQAADMQYAPTFFGCDGLDGILGVDGFDTALAEGVMLLTPFAADDMAKATQDFVSKYEDAYKATPSQFAADAYDAVYVIKAAAEAAEITADMSASDICDALVEQMKTIEVEGITSVEGVPMKWDENGMVDKAPKAVIITDGAYKAM